MEDFKLKILSRLKEIKIRGLIYPSISGLFILIALILFIFSANFISKHINLALEGGEAPGSILSLNKSDFEPIKNKLNIEINESAEVNQAPAQVNAPIETKTTATETLPIENTGTTTISSAPEAITPEERASLKISVLNSTKTSGLAAELKKILETSEFTVGKTGNISPTIDGVTLKIKIGKEKFKDSLVSAVSAKYTISEFQEIPESDPYDIVIIIGK